MVKPLDIFRLAAEPSWLAVVIMDAMLEEVAISVKLGVAVTGLADEKTPVLSNLVDLLVVVVADPAGVACGFIHLVSVHVTVSKLVVKIVDVMTFPETSEYKL